METPKDIYASAPRQTDHRARVLILTADKTEDLEFFYPYYRFLEEGYAVDVATPKGGSFKGKEGLGLQATKKISDIQASQYDFLFIPGGKAPEALKKEDTAIEIVKSFASSNKPIAAICHGPQVLAAADVIRRMRIAAWPDVQKEVEAAGAEYCNQETVQDGLFITARWPADLPAFTHSVVQMVNHRIAHNNKAKAA